jgi:hypothetical protein
MDATGLLHQVVAACQWAPGTEATTVAPACATLCDDHGVGDWANDPYAAVVCGLCHSGDDEELLLLCDGCDRGFHTYCLQIHEIPLVC